MDRQIARLKIRYRLDRGWKLGSAQHRFDARHERQVAEWLCDIIIGAYLERTHLIDVFAFRTQHDDRHVRHTADQPQDFQPIHAWPPPTGRRNWQELTEPI